MFDETVSGEYYLNAKEIETIKNTNYKRNNYVEDTKRLLAGQVDGFRIMDYRYDDGLRIRKNGVSPTLTTKSSGSISGTPLVYQSKDFLGPNVNEEYYVSGGRLRHLTPKECWRLQGFIDKEFEKAEKVCSNAQLYKQAGNSITVNVLVNILKNLLDEDVHNC